MKALLQRDERLVNFWKKRGDVLLSGYLRYGNLEGFIAAGIFRDLSANGRRLALPHDHDHK